MPRLDELEAAGWSGIEVRCQGCRYTTIFEFRCRSRWLRPNDTLAELAQRLTCSRCRIRPLLQDVKAYFNAVPHGSRAPAPSHETPARPTPKDEAAALLSSLGSLAAHEARERSRTAGMDRRYADARYWTRVAAEIAVIEGRADEVGMQTADRYGR